MSLRRKRTLNDRTNESKRAKGDDDDVFEDSSTSLSKSTNQGRKRLNGTSTYRVKEKENKHPIKSKETETIPIDQTVNQLLEEQARIDAHSLAIQIN